MSGPAQIAGKKRKAPDGTTQKSAHARKHLKKYEAWNITTETADAALSKTGELNIASFVKSREHEINALETGMRKARQGLTSRAFQQLPRHLRRRTASHNVKKVPRRLQRRARREMKEDNTPTVTSKSKTPSAKLRLRLENVKSLKRATAQRKLARRKKKEDEANAGESDPAKHIAIVRAPRIKKNKLAEAPRATSKYKKRQVDKTWLPTHLWHTKRAHMTRPVEPLWRTAVAVSPTEKCYRSSHRATGSRGCVAWDMSYMSTIGCLGTDVALESLLKAVGFAGARWSGSQCRNWKSGSRFAFSWVCGHDKHKEPIAPVEVIWSPLTPEVSTETLAADENDHNVDMTRDKQDATRKHTKLDRRLFLRVHPSAFAQLWAELLKVAKLQKPQVLLEDLRFEIGSIDVTGPGSTEALAGVLKYAGPEGLTEKVWSRLAGLANPASLPVNALLALETSDPRLHHPPKQIKIERDEEHLLALTKMTIDWPLDNAPPQSTIFSHKARHIASDMPSQKAINRRKALSLPGQPLSMTERDHSIPVMLLAQRPKISMSNAQGTWTILTPWNCIDSIWRSLIYYPLTSGRPPRFGGLNEKRQIAFEQAVPWFPGDFPGSQAGQAWERSESEKRFDDWIRKPPSRRIAFDNVDLGADRRGELGRGWACDWEYLFEDSSRRGVQTVMPKDTKPTNPLPYSDSLLTQRQRKAAKAKAAVHVSNKARSPISPGTDSDTNRKSVKSDLTSTIPYTQFLPSSITSLVGNKALRVSLQPCLITVTITYLTRGTPSPAARIYRLPKSSSRPQATPVVVEPSLATHPAAMQSNFVPPSAQPSPPVLPSTTSTISAATTQDLRSRWLGLDRSKDASIMSSHVGKIRSNHHSLPCKQSHLPIPSLRHINVLPKNAPAEVIEQYGPKPLTEAEQQAELDELLRVKLDEEKIWEVHVPCPEQHDLIGFVTSGGYNLAQGKGTAMGGLWVQRLVEGWREEDVDATTNRTGTEEKQEKRRVKQRDRERQLCVVRNAGESIGRLAIWELCV